MRMSCNGCRVLRKGCNENCSIRPCLQWIKTSQSQANATVFLAKFYGRAGLINLINAGPEPHRPAIFKSLLYEACGRIVNPIYGSSGLLWTGSWQICQAAVEAVLKGASIMPISSESAGSHMSPPLKACDIRHVSKDDNFGPSHKIRKVNKSRNRFKRSGVKKLKPRKAVPGMATELRFDESSRIEWPKCCKIEIDGSASHDESEKTHPRPSRGGESGGEADCVSVETVEVSAVKSAEERDDCSDVELELTLGRHWNSSPYPEGHETVDGADDDTYHLRTGIDLPPVRSS